MPKGCVSEPAAATGFRNGERSAEPPAISHHPDRVSASGSPAVARSRSWPVSLGNGLARFREARRGSVAVEFALLALPFSLLIFAIIETSVSFTAQQFMSNVTDDIARQLRTGQLGPSDVAGNKLKNLICDKLKLVVASGCPELEVDLESYAAFDDVPTDIPFTTSGDIDTSGFKVDPGGSQSINQLRVFYRWPIMTDVMRSKMSSLPGGKTLLYSTVTWQNEPY